MTSYVPKFDREPGLAPEARFPVVALASSAGGLNALFQVLGPLPADLPAAVLVAQHQQPDRPNRLPQLLDARSRLTVRSARDGDTLEQGTVLVTPPGSHLLVVSDNRIGLIDVGKRALPPRPTADMMLATLAVTCGPRALAVVLTGVGTDAQSGIRAVTCCGGRALAQDEASSAHFGMPGAAISTGEVDMVLPLTEIAKEIQAHVTAVGEEGPDSGSKAC
ncbi:chemotaxis protein CheB [Streptomyces purpurogeneiscleroticus]|uniref:chemotaxis protein CheB n=1 Tax=Streptomyces purpurogeneiscleroticus TaxID=68259 RepID=UPI001CBE2867|nr:chemotaxis protein CheB [Streptomyces purpurogeneiscleroticus]MBZ4019265.1 chemotaxis protein CheB [Streptomyces purpurogeneiscleroticus]